MRFTSEHIEAFAGLSGDRNPLHCDQTYASRTQFGRIVVFGMATVLIALSRWANGRAFVLKTIQGEFSRPVFLDEELELEISVQDVRVVAKWHKQGVVLSRCTFEFVPEAVPLTVAHDEMARASSRFKDSTGFASIARTDRDPPSSRESALYSLNPEYIGRFETSFGLSVAQLPFDQFNQLLWASYYVGMIYPGQQALFSSFDITFGGDSRPSTPQREIRYSEIARIGMVTLRVSGAGLEKMVVRSLRRPEPVNYSIDCVRNEVGRSDRLAGRTAFISGASRGLGAVIAKAIAMHGARVLVNCRANAGEAAKVRDEIVSAGGWADVIVGDLADPKVCVRIATALKAPLDILINNASPAIAPRAFAEQTPGEFDDFVRQSLGLYLNPTHALLPLMPAGSTIVSISSAYVSTPPVQFSHYVAAKAAIEGMLEAVAREEKEKRFLTVRLPRILTDQTNVNYSANPPLNATAIIVQLLSWIENPEYAGVKELEPKS